TTGRDCSGASCGGAPTSFWGCAVRDSRTVGYRRPRRRVDASNASMEPPPGQRVTEAELGRRPAVDWRWGGFGPQTDSVPGAPSAGAPLPPPATTGATLCRTGSPTTGRTHGHPAQAGLRTGAP